MRGRRNTRPRVVIPLALTGAAVVVGAAAALLLLLLLLPQPAASPKPSTTTRMTTTASDPRGAVAAALTRLPSNPSALVPDERRNTIDLRDAVPEGTTVTPDPSSWRAATPDSGTMRIEARRPGAEEVGLLAVMVRQHGSWRLLATYPVVDR